MMLTKGKLMPRNKEWVFEWITILFVLLSIVGAIFAVLLGIIIIITEPWISVILFFVSAIVIPGYLLSYFHNKIGLDSVPELEDSIWPSTELADLLDQSKGEFEHIEDVDWSLGCAKPIDEHIDFVGKRLPLDSHLLKSMPSITLSGLELLLERFGPGKMRTWAGVLARDLVTCDDSDRQLRCLQYIYIYTRQHGVLTIIWWVVVPLVMGIWNMLFSWQPWTFTFFIFSPLAILGFLDSYGDPHRKLHTTTPLVAFWLIQLLAAIDYLIPSMILIGLAMVFFVWWLLDLRGTLPTGHAMDYIPVFVWLRKVKSESNEDYWKLHRVAWDSYHYRAGTMDYDNLEKNGYLLPDRSVVTLHMNNPWHSLSLRKSREKILDKITAVVMVGSFPLPVTCVLLYLFGWLQDPWWFLIFTVGFPFFCVVALCCYQLYTFPLKRKTNKNLRLLQHEHLKVLWNLRLKAGSKWRETITGEPQLVIVGKMQDPFSDIDSFTSFRDDIGGLYRRIRTLEENLREKSD
jgi:hypothetical protein